MPSLSARKPRSPPRRPGVRSSAAGVGSICPAPKDGSERLCAWQRAKTRAAQVAPVISELRSSGANTLRELASGLYERGILASRGGR
jgi:hypothetical protein